MPVFSFLRHTNLLFLGSHLGEVAAVMLSRVSLATLPAGFSPVSGANNDFSEESFISRLV
jgi:hypothetical protein